MDKYNQYFSQQQKEREMKLDQEWSVRPSWKGKGFPADLRN